MSSLAALTQLTHLVMRDWQGARQDSIPLYPRLPSSLRSLQLHVCRLHQARFSVKWLAHCPAGCCRQLTEISVHLSENSASVRRPGVATFPCSLRRLCISAHHVFLHAFPWQASSTPGPAGRRLPELNDHAEHLVQFVCSSLPGAPGDWAEGRELDAQRSGWSLSLQCQKIAIAEELQPPSAAAGGNIAVAPAPQMLPDLGALQGLWGVLQQRVKPEELHIQLQESTRPFVVQMTRKVRTLNQAGVGTHGGEPQWRTQDEVSKEEFTNVAVLAKEAAKLTSKAAAEEGNTACRLSVVQEQLSIAFS